MRFIPALSLACLALWMTAAGHAQTDSATPSVLLSRATELRADKLANAAVVTNLVSGAAAKLLGIEGGWAQLEVQGRQTGWVRASALNLQAGTALAASVPNGRNASNNVALSLGVRSLKPRDNRHALIIGIGKYADPSVPGLPGTVIDRESATQMAHAMQVPDANIRYLQDEQATGAGIRRALAELNARVEEGDRVFVHYSGHGTRYNDPVAGGCVEALLAYDGGTAGTVTNREMADLLKPLTQKTDKLFVMYDACHSGGVIQAASTVRTRGFSNANDEGELRPKFAAISEACGRPVNVKSRNLTVEQVATGVQPQDIVHVSASRDNEVSFDDAQKGGLATQYLRDCMLRDAKDLDNSGAITMDEIRQCAQDKINKRMQGDAMYKPHNISMNGNTGFVPAWFSLAAPVAAPLSTTVAAPVASPASSAKPTVQAATPAASTKPAASASAVVAVAAPVAVLVPPPALTGEQALRQMFAQRDAKRQVKVTVSRDKLKIGQDAFDFAVQSERAGYVYVALAGSDNQSLYLLFPNDLDADNRIQAGQQLLLPRPNWRVKAAGPAGVDNLLVMVSDGPRDVVALNKMAADKAASDKATADKAAPPKSGPYKAGPFVASLNDAHGRAALGALMSTSRTASDAECNTPAKRRATPACSDAYGAAMFAVDEVK